MKEECAFWCAFPEDEKAGISKGGNCAIFDIASSLTWLGCELSSLVEVVTEADSVIRHQGDHMQ